MVVTQPRRGFTGEHGAVAEGGGSQARSKQLFGIGQHIHAAPLQQRCARDQRPMTHAVGRWRTWWWIGRLVAWGINATLAPTPPTLGRVPFQRIFLTVRSNGWSLLASAGTARSCVHTSRLTNKRTPTCAPLPPRAQSNIHPLSSTQDGMRIQPLVAAADDERRGRGDP